MEKVNITFLGSGGGRKVTASQARATGGFVVQACDEQIHVDPGPGAIVRAAQFGVDVKSNTIILVSHFHVDHSNDTNALVDAITFGGKEKHGVLITSDGCEDDNLTEFHKNAVEKYVKVKPGEKTQIGDVWIEATKTFGHGLGNVGYKIITPEFVLGYTSDTSFFPELVDEFKGCNVLVVNTLKPKGTNIFSHMNSDDVVELLKGVKPKMAILQHFGNSMIEAGPASEAVEIQTKSGVKTIAAQDGLVIDIIP